jgi:hypothetical protein
MAGWRELQFAAVASAAASDGNGRGQGRRFETIGKIQ